VTAPAAAPDAAHVPGPHRRLVRRARELEADLADLAAVDRAGGTITVTPR
jgi:hypothetical protein